MKKVENPSKKTTSQYQDKFNILVSTYGVERIKFNELLKYHTFSKLGGPAEAFYIATNQKELKEILDNVTQLKIPYFVFGNGTKILISEQGMNGLIIRNRTSAVKISGIKGKVGKFGLGIEEALLEVDSGVSLGKMNEFLNEQNLQTFEGFSSLHATLGGAIFLDPMLQNIVTNIKVWENEAIFDIPVSEIKRQGQVVLSLVIKVKAKF